MTEWKHAAYEHRMILNVVDPLRLGRRREPVRVDLVFDTIKPHADGLLVTDPEGTPVPSQVVSQDENGGISSASLYFLADVPAGGSGLARYCIYLSEKAQTAPAFEGIRQLPTRLADGVRRLDTGHYVMELCRGTGGGDGGSKWGIRDIEAKAQGIPLIHNAYNALGGVYGPFFTPENGLVNPPAHMIIDVEPVFEGPVACRYRLHGEIPEGLRPELAGKRLNMVWTFFAQSPWFVRTYNIDPFETVVDGRPVVNRITVGDELESGKNNLLLYGYMHKGGTAYRSGDLYAEILLDRIRDLQAREPDLVARAMERLGIDPAEDPSAWHWDNYWRMFCVLEGAMERSVLERETESIWQHANEIVWSDVEHNRVKYSEGMVDVSREPEQTIFPTNARKTCAFNPLNGYSFVHYVSAVVPRMQIVQRFASGWVNWGTNGENEFPELPLGSTIWAAYGRFDDWQKEVDRMETPIVASAGLVERHYALQH